MTAKLKCLLSAFFGALAAFVSWLSTVPPETQSGWLATLVDITPVEYRPNLALFTRALTFFLTIYTAYNAAHSTKETPLIK